MLQRLASRDEGHLGLYSAPVSPPPTASRARLDSPPLAAAPFGSEPGRALLQRRVAMFARIQALISLAFLTTGIVIALAVLPTRPVPRSLIGLPNIFHLAAVLCALAIWLVARRGRLERAHLTWLDLGATLFPMLGYAAMAISSRGLQRDRNDLLVTLIAVLVLMLRATLVPSRPKVTAAISAASCVPVLVVAYVVGLTADPKIPSYALPVMLGIWCGAATFTATLATHVIYGLRKQAARAEQLGQYVLDDKIGEGGMGAVYRARHALLRRPTAIKLLSASKAGEHALSRFEREVQQTSRLTHPNTVAIYDYGHTPDGVFYYAMELLDGLDLQELVDRCGPQPPERVVHVLAQVCGSLEEAHGAGLVHRDIKPANIILCERGGIADTAKVVDFGLVKDVNTQSEPELSSANAILGTPLYMAPEAMLSPDTVDARADVYALAAVGCFLLTGEPIFSGSSVLEVCTKHLHDQPPAPSSKAGSAVPPELDGVLLACLAKKPEERLQSARAFRDALVACEVPAWTQERAKSWWAEHVASRSVPSQRDASSDSPTVVQVDLDERDAAG